MQRKNSVLQYGPSWISKIKSSATLVLYKWYTHKRQIHPHSSRTSTQCCSVSSGVLQHFFPSTQEPRNTGFHSHGNPCTHAGHIQNETALPLSLRELYAVTRPSVVSLQAPWHFPQVASPAPQLSPASFHRRRWSSSQSVTASAAAPPAPTLHQHDVDTDNHLHQIFYRLVTGQGCTTLCYYYHCLLLV